MTSTRLVKTDTDAFRRTLGRFTTGVVAVTGLTELNEPTGLAVNSFTSVSLQPPLVSFCAARTSVTWPRLRGTGRICINILSEHQQDVSRHLSARGGDKFRHLSWSPSPSALPVLDGALAWLECSLTAEHAAGDHDIVVAHVDHLASDLTTAGPLVYYRGSYSELRT
ncbi:flavin reductase family protein [Streptomyces sp. NPDC091265]|uniref:flavin reductase family protein n=1 Tax=unclassified Streptomyces TaxID=2593676 RepID=UPI00344D0900